MLYSKATEGSDIGLKVFQEIGHHANNETGICGVKGDHKQCLTAGRIAKNLGLNRKTVGRWIDRIVESGELEILAQSAQKGAGAWRVFKVNVPFEDVPLIGTPKSDPLIEENSGNGTPKSDPLIEEMSHLQEKMGHLEELMGHLMGHMTELMGHKTPIMGHPSRGSASKYPEYPIDTNVSNIKGVSNGDTSSENQPNQKGKRRVPPGYFDGLTDKQALERFKSPHSSDPIPFQERTTLEKKFFQLTGKYPLRAEVDALFDLGYTPQLLERHFGEADPGPDYWHWKRKGFVWQRDKTPNQGMNKNILMDNAHTALKWKPVQATAPSGNSTQPYVEFF